MRSGAWTVVVIGTIGLGNACGGSDSTSLEPSGPEGASAPRAPLAGASAGEASGPANSANSNATDEADSLSSKLNATAAGGTPISSTAPDATASPEPSTIDEITSYQTLAQGVQSEAQSYRASMLAPDVTLANCAPLYTAHDAAVRPLVSQMLEQGQQMDALLQLNGRAAFSDIECTARTLNGELDRYAGVACQSADLAAAQTAAVQHADAMSAYAARVYERCGQMESGLGNDGAVGWAPMMGGCTQSAASS
ncbi:MAG TPA: hypothetical protein VG963_17215, partial [Polyangiaceae bacterium]|nr:hypothetical protein [Polyangiaceae bacterium]